MGFITVNHSQIIQQGAIRDGPEKDPLTKAKHKLRQKTYPTKPCRNPKWDDVYLRECMAVCKVTADKYGPKQC